MEIRTAAPLIPKTNLLSALRDAAAGCQACPLWKTGTQTVFGEGGRRAKVILIGEQPGNDEDLICRKWRGFCEMGKAFDLIVLG